MTVQFEDDSALAFSRGLGALVGILIPITTLLKAMKSHFESNYSRKCTLSLTLVAGGWALSSVGYAIHLLGSGLDMLFVTAVVVTCGLDVVGIVTAILGLIEVAGDHRQPLLGRRQAVWALILAPIFLAGAAFGATHPADPIPNGWRIGSQPLGTKVPNGSKGFSFVTPGQEWVQVDARKLNPVADLAFAHSKHQVFFILIAQAIPAGATLSTDKAAEGARGDFRKLDAQGRVGEPQPESIGGLAGLGFSAIAPSPKGQLLSYRVWVYASATFAYELVTWGRERAADTVLQDAKEVIKGFELLNP
jgi:hypothetical protein